MKGSVVVPHAGVLTRLGPSSIHGVGVFAIIEITKGRQLFAFDEAEICWIEAEAVENAELGPSLRALYRDFAIRRDGMLGCPASFDMLTPGWYINQPPDGVPPSVHVTEDFRMFAARLIDVGEELTLNYGAFNRGPVWN